MWLRSQDKKKILNCNGFAIHTEKTGEVNIYGYIADETWDNTWLTGTYSSEEKAFKVLDMIQEKIDFIERVKLSVCLLTRTKEVFFENKNIFQMPLDSEVE